MNKDELKEALATALEQEAYEQLETLAKEAVSAYPQEAFGYAYLGEALLGELPIPFPEVELCLAKASELEPKNTHYLERFAVVKTFQGEKEAAQLMWGKILSLNPNHVEALTAKGEYHLNTTQDHEQALSFLNRALEQDQQKVATLLYRADTYNRMEQYEAALQDVRQAIQLEPEFNPQVTLLTISIFKNLGQIKEVLPLYEELIAKDEEENYLYHYEYALTLIEIQELTKAVEQLIKANELTNNQDGTILYLLGETALKDQQYEVALTAFKQCLEVKPELSEAAFHVVTILIKQGQLKEALDAVKKLSKSVKGDAFSEDRALVLEGQVLVALKEYKKAEDILVPVAKKQGLYQKEAYFQLGLLYHQQGDAPKAYKFVKAAAAGQHEEASQYLRTELSEIVDQLRTAAIAANKAAFSKNEKSNFLNKVFGKLWVFDTIKSERLNDFGPEQIENVKQSLASSSLMMAEKGILMLSDRQEEMATYKIQKETASGALLEFLPMDGFASFVAKLQLTKDGNLVFSKEKGEAVLYKEQNPNDVDNTIKAVYQAKIQTEDAQYLGEKTAPVLEKIL